MNKSLSLFRIATALLAWLPDSLHAETDLTDLNLEELLAVKITSVAKKVQPLQDSAAAVFVISDEDIKRSGATSIPDALRLAPGIDVGRIDSNKWAVSARGFNGRFANKLLVLIDGRSLYTRIRRRVLGIAGRDAGRRRAHRSHPRFRRGLVGRQCRQRRGQHHHQT
ncbi:TonB-dependent receptor plug domain-containing protein [Methylomonas koyamae]|uniref:TonB-dependent receptor plug domain-containing protein n=1 Tax=Methylomonas koyamae TaxID=702114 RepID=UPI0012F68164|nr:Plug domain-containing protein [Methylomonas koyamae]